MTLGGGWKPQLQKTKMRRDLTTRLRELGFLAVDHFQRSHFSFAHPFSSSLAHRQPMEARSAVEPAPMRSFLTRLLTKSDAATSVEYAVMLALILMVVFASVVYLGTSTKGSLDNANSNLSAVGFGAGS